VCEQHRHGRRWTRGFPSIVIQPTASVKLMKAEQDNYTGGKRRVLKITPHIEVFHLNKLLVPGVQIGIQMYFNCLNLILERCECSWKIDTRRGQSRNVPVFKVTLNPSIYRQLMTKMNVNRALVAYPTVKSQIRAFTKQGNQQRYECNNLF